MDGTTDKTANQTDMLEKLTALAKRRGFFYISSEIYGGLAGLYDYGTTGTLLKKNIENLWRNYFLDLSDNFFEIEASNIMPKDVFVASGHLTSFVDPMTKCTACGSFYRADHLVGNALKRSVEDLKPDKLTELVRENDIKCPRCGGKLGDVKILNMMLPVRIGVEENTDAYLRPETAQGAYVNFLKQYEILRGRLPLGLAIIGKAFRNEISPRQLLIRQREFTQAELQIFFDPENIDKHDRWDEIKDYPLQLLLDGAKVVRKISCEEANAKLGLPKFYVYYLARVQQFFLKVIKFPAEDLRLRELSKDERAFYNKLHFDVELFMKSLGEFKELGGIHYRTDHDLSGHQEISKKSQEIVHENKKFIPHVLELSVGIDRIFFGAMDRFYRNTPDREWEWFEFPLGIAPFRFAVFPLFNKKGMPETAMGVFRTLRKEHVGIYDDSGSIGKRYARVDEIGVPYSITIDYDTKKDNSVTVRDRNTSKQVRVPIGQLSEALIKPIEG